MYIYTYIVSKTTYEYVNAKYVYIIYTYISTSARVCVCVCVCVCLQRFYWHFTAFPTGRCSATPTRSPQSRADFGTSATSNNGPLPGKKKYIKDESLWNFRDIIVYIS